MRKLKLVQGTQAAIEAIAEAKQAKLEEEAYNSYKCRYERNNDQHMMSIGHE